MVRAPAMTCRATRRGNAAENGRGLGSGAEEMSKFIVLPAQFPLAQASWRTTLPAFPLATSRQPSGRPPVSTSLPAAPAAGNEVGAAAPACAMQASPPAPALLDRFARC